MAESRDDIEPRLRRLLEQRATGVLATQDGGQPYGSVMAFAVTPDLRELIFATGRATRKAANLDRDCRAAMVIDDRTGCSSDLYQAMAVTASGRVKTVVSSDHRALRFLLAKHPSLSDLVSAPSCRVYRLLVATYYVVRAFREVTELEVRR
jgi:nitroimidazol reductase NimA-like FMN-containing flavoprotein (pyridoxamine 5'-phosphate oxidase superfamily)